MKELYASIRKFSEDYTNEIRIALIVASSINVMTGVPWIEYLGMFWLMYLIFVPASFIVESIVDGKVVKQ